MTTSIFQSIYLVISTIVSSAINTSLKVILIVLNIFTEFYNNAGTMSALELFAYTLVLFIFVTIVVKFLMGSIKGLLYFGFILFVLWLLFI